MADRHSTDSVRAHERFEYWREQVCRTFVGLDVHAPASRAFFGRLASRAAGRCLLVRAEGASQVISRTERLIRDDDAHCTVVMLQRAGQATVVQDGRRTMLRPDQIALIDSSRPYRLEFHQPFVQDVVKLPTELLERRLPAAAALAARSIDCTTLSGRMLAAALGAAGGDAEDDGPAHAIGRLEAPVIELLALALDREGSDGVHDADAPLRVRRAKAYILARLGDPSLRIEDIAAAQHVSPRLLQRLFAAEGGSMSTWIVEQRLLRCHRTLAAGTADGRTITEIALAHGFADPSHFGRAFRRRFGVPPSVLRATGSPGV